MFFPSETPSHCITVRMTIVSHIAIRIEENIRRGRCPSLWGGWKSFMKPDWFYITLRAGSIGGCTIGCCKNCSRCHVKEEASKCFSLLVTSPAKSFHYALPLLRIHVSLIFLLWSSLFVIITFASRVRILKLLNYIQEIPCEGRATKIFSSFSATILINLLSLEC